MPSALYTTHTHTPLQGPEAAGGGGQGDCERGQSSRIKTKRSCIQELMLRVLDKSAYTRYVFARVYGEEGGRHGEVARGQLYPM